MKRLLLCLFLALFGIGQLAAHGEGKLRKHYLNVSYVSQTLKLAKSAISKDELSMPGSLKSTFGAAITYGRTFFLNIEQLNDNVHLGIDATFADLTYVRYKNYVINVNMGGGSVLTSRPMETDQMDFSLGVGPSVTLTPYDRLSIHVYFRYAPTFSMLTVDGASLGNYASFFVTGGAVSWGMIGVGAEARFGGCVYKYFNMPDAEVSKTPRLKTPGVRAYVTLRF